MWPYFTSGGPVPASRKDMNKYCHNTSDCFQGITYLLENNLVDDDAMEIAKWIHGTKNINWEQRRMFLDTR